MSLTSRITYHPSVSLLFFLIFITVKCTSVGQPSPVTVEESFKQCLISQPSATLGYCLGTGAIAKLQTWDSDPQFDLIDGLTLSKDQQEYREAYNFVDRDPADFRTLLDSFGHVFSRRNLHWDMGFLYPGLAMRVAPSTSAGGVLEFVLDPHREVLNKHALKEFGTGRLIARQFLLPFLLGFKFNVATIIPILFGILALLAKKAVIISKLALIVSSAYGLGTLLLGNGDKFQNPFTNPTHSAQHFNPGFGGHYNRYPEEEYQEVVYRGISGNGMLDDNTQNENTDQFKLYTNLQEVYKRGDNVKGRNFAWSDDEKKSKIAKPAKK